MCEELLMLGHCGTSIVNSFSAVDLELFGGDVAFVLVSSTRSSTASYIVTLDITTPSMYE